jgi:hypothetical protein
VPRGVRDADAVRARLGRGVGHAQHLLHAAPNGVLGSIPDVQSMRLRVGYAVLDEGRGLVDVLAELLLEPLVRDAEEDADPVRVRPQHEVDVALERAGVRDDLGPQPQTRDLPRGLEDGGRDGRVAGLDVVHAEVVQGAGDGELLVQREVHAGRLLALAQRRVEELDAHLTRPSLPRPRGRAPP